MTKNFRIQEKWRAIKKQGIVVKISAILILLFVVAAICAPICTPYSPTELSLLDQMKPPSSEHLLGTDNLGRDVLTRIIYGARISLTTSLLSGIIAAALGLFLGLLAGYMGGAVGQVIMRLTDAQLSLPPIVLIMVLATLFGGGVQGVSIVIGISMMPTYIRMMYGMVLSLKEQDYICAARLVGKSQTSIMFRHLLPNCFPSLIVLFTMNLGSSIMIESSLSYLGIGIAPPTPAWGSMVSEGYRYIVTNPSLALLPGVCVILVVVSFNIVGDALRDALDPRLRGKL